MMNSEQFGPKVIVHEENPKEKFINKVLGKQGKSKEDYFPKPIVEERKIDHD